MGNTPNNPDDCWPLGLYEKALSRSFSLGDKLEAAERLGFSFLELSIDESDEKLSRLRWSREKIKTIRSTMNSAPIPIRSVCLSAHRRYPLGSGDPAVVTRSQEMFARCVDLAIELGIRLIQVSGYDVFYEEHSEETRSRYIDGLHWAASIAQSASVMLAVENVDVPVTATMTNVKEIIDTIESPWLSVYGDVGNTIANGRDVVSDLQRAGRSLTMLHVKDTKPGIFRGISFGNGVVPFDSVFLELERAPYHGPIVIEMWNEDLDDATARVAEARTFLGTRMEWLKRR